MLALLALAVRDYGGSGPRVVDLIRKRCDRRRRKQAKRAKRHLCP